MIKPNTGGAKRVATGAVVAATSALMLGVPFATAANAAPTAGTITATPTHTNYQAGATATINVTATHTPTELEYTILSGPDGTGAAAYPSGVDCASQTQCTFTNSGTAGTDQVRVFDGGTAANDSDFVSGDPSADLSIKFSGPPASVALTPDTASKSASQCEVFTATAKDASNGASGQANLTITATQAVSTGTAQPLSFCTPLGTGGTNTTTGTSPNFTNTATETVTTGDDGTVMFGVESSQAGSVNVKAAYGATAFDNSTLTVTGGQTGANNVASLQASPTSSTGYTGTGNTYTVTALDSNGDPVVSGVTVQYEITSGPDATGSGNYPNCGTISDADGTTTCTITNGGTAGTDDINFFVNQTTGTGSHTTGPDTGEPQAAATATFNTRPAVSTITLTSADASNGGAASTASTIPTTQKTVTFTATVEDSSSNPISGAIVSFTNNSYHAASPAITPQTQDVTTGADGTAQFVVTDSAPANGDVISVSAEVGNTGPHPTSTATYQTAAPATFSLTPPVQSVARGGTVTETATVVDQFGTGVSGQNITYSVTGRNNGQTGSATTGSDGTAAISYTDAGVNAASNTDTITATDTAANAPGTNTDTATIDYVASATATSVTVDLSGGACPPATAHNTANSTIGSNTQVCAVVKNSTGEVLAGKSVTFTVSDGTVGTDPATDTDTYTTTTAADGTATATATSTTSGAQTVTVTADAASGTGTITYAAPAATAARTITLTPATATVTPGDSQTFTAAVKDQYGNGVPNVTVTFSKNGPGNFGAVSSVSAPTDSTGTASATLTTSSSDTGSGSVTATIGTTGTQCSDAAGTPAGTTTAGNCSTSSAYTLGSSPSGVTLSAASGVKAGGTETVTATVTNSDGTAAANVVVQFSVSGANTATGSATTNASGVATFSYTAASAGSDAVSAYADANGNGTQDTGEPSGTTTATIAQKQITITTRPTLHAHHSRVGPGAVEFKGSGTAHATIQLKYKSHGSYHNLKTTTVHASGNWRVFVHISHTHTYIVREEGQKNSNTVRVVIKKKH